MFPKPVQTKESKQNIAATMSIARRAVASRGLTQPSSGFSKVYFSTAYERAEVYFFYCVELHMAPYSLVVFFNSKQLLSIKFELQITISIK